MTGARLRATALACALAVALPAADRAVAAPPERFFGVDPQGALEASDYALMRETGVGTLRFELHWGAIDLLPPGGGYDWSSSDAIVARAAENGIRALPFVYGAPPWVSASDPPRGPEALAEWRAFLAAAVHRYGPRGEFWSENPSLPRMPIRDWQIWNEQNSPTYWEPRPDVGEYAKLLHAAHAAITERDPGARLILGGMFGTPFAGLKPGIAAWDFLTRLYREPGARDDFDAVAPHPYAARFAGVRDQIDRFRRRMVRAGDGRAQLWITELGWASGGVPHPLNPGRAGQARRLRRAFHYLIDRRRELRLANVTWYSWRDSAATDAGLCVWCPESGLLDAGGAAKPSLDAFAELTGAR
jgi:hypothetical protein